MKRSPIRPQSLKHLPFFEVLANEPEGSEAAKLATAGLLTLRMIDHWVLAGPAIVEPESVSVRSVRQAIMALPPKEAVRESLLTIVNTMQMLRHVDLIPVLPRVFAFAQLLERHHGKLALAGDAYESVIRLADPEFDAEVAMDAYERLSFCQRKLGALDGARESAATLVKLAVRRKDHARMLRGKISIGIVSMMRGNLPDADSQFVAIAAEAQRRELQREYGMATHNRAVVASRGGNVADAVVLAHESLKHTSDPIGRERVLSDLAAFLVKLEDYDAAIDALRILEVTAVSDEPRQTARVNLLILAARIGDQKMFESARRELVGVNLTVEVQVNVLIETARGLEIFGEQAEAEELLARAEAEATRHSLGRSIAEIDEIRRTAPSVQSRAKVAFRQATPTSEVASDLRRMAAALIEVS
jgi:tetratricopeptide (TPR) repeat protein